MKNALTLGLGLAIGIGLVACTAAATTEEAPEVAPIVNETPLKYEVEYIETYGEWMTAHALCGDTRIGEERLVTTMAVYTGDDGELVYEATEEELEGRIRDLTPEEIEALDCGTSEIPQEDDPDWNWKTHGNRTAGGTVTMFDGETFEVLVTVNSDGSYSITKK